MKLKAKKFGNDETYSYLHKLITSYTENLIMQ